MSDDPNIASWDRVADAYVTHLLDELDDKPFDRQQLDAMAAALAPGARVLDAGCGPGHVGAYLAARGLDVTGVDLAPAMIAAAERCFPELHFVVGDLRAPPFPADSFDAIVAFYSLIHLRPHELAAALRGLSACLRRDGVLLVAVHSRVTDPAVAAPTATVVQTDELWGHDVNFTATLISEQALCSAATQAGLTVVDSTVREPGDAEYPSQRTYALMRRASG